MLKDFYLVFATVCFTLLGLWLIVVQTRHAEWRTSAVHRRRAYLRPLRLEAVLLTLLVFLGVNVAWLLLFDDVTPEPAPTPASVV